MLNSLSVFHEEKTYKKKYSRHSCMIDLLTVLTLYVCATFISFLYFYIVPILVDTYTVHLPITLEKNDISYDAPIL